jgi:serine/threonine protein kinase
MPDIPLKLPAQLGRYKLLRLISRGGMAYVYEARRESMAGVSPKVAIKMILPDKAKDEAYKELFITEAKVSSTLMHRNLVHIQDFEEVNGAFFLVMEFVEGITLRDAIRTARRHGIPIPIHVIAEVGRQICDGLHHAHRATTSEGRPLGLVHCDIKPSNVIVNKQGMVKVLDFGVSHASISTVNKKALRGTWGYMAPEQVDNDLVTPRTDLFSVAVLLYEMASLRPMFIKKEKVDNRLMRKFLKGDEAARRANSMSGNYNSLIPILVRSLQRDPSGRYLSAEDMGEALAGLVPDPVIARTDLNSFLVKLDELRSKGERTAMISPFDDQEDFSGQSIRMEKKKKQGEKDSKRQFALLFLLLFPLILVVALYGIFSLFLSSDRPDPPDATKVNTPTQEVQMEIIEETKSEGVFEDVVKPKQRPKTKSKVKNKEPKKADKKKEQPPKPEVIEEIEAPVRIMPEKEEKEVVEEKKPQKAKFGRITISADQKAKVFIDGKKMGQAPLYKYQISTGEHRIHIAKDDGQVKKFVVNVKGGDSLIYQWSFADQKWLRSGK